MRVATWSFLKWVSLLVGLLLTQSYCSSRQNAPIVPCGCSSTALIEPMHEVAAQVINTGLIEHGHAVFALNIRVSDFNQGGSFTVGDNILLPCDSLSSTFQQTGLGVSISYLETPCSANLTSPSFRSVYGRLIHLLAIRKTN